VHLDFVLGWSPLTDLRVFKAKYENEHLTPALPMNLDFSWTPPCNIQALFIVSGNDRPHPNLLPPEKGQRWYAPLYVIVRRANPIAGFLEMRQPFLPLLGGESRGEDGREQGQRLIMLGFAEGHRANPVAGAFWFRGSRRELVGGNLTPFCYRKRGEGGTFPAFA
jgi:hypothetical protein